jgi:glycosyltransferase involved in cell wall biosynthesis
VPDRVLLHAVFSILQLISAMPPSTPTVSVVVPTHNRAALLLLTLRSVLRQRDVDLEVVVVDDGSTEPVQHAVDRLGDSRIRVIRHDQPRGVSAARNRGAAAARGRWIAFLDDDDLWSPDKLRLQLDSAEVLQRDWVYAGCVFVDAQLHVHGGTPPLPAEEMKAALLSYNAVPAGASNVLVRADVLKGVGGFDETLTHVPDWDLWLRLARHASAACVDAPLVGYRIHAQNASFRTAQMLAELVLLERRYGLTRTRSRFHRHLAHLCLRANRRREAFTYFLRALLNFRHGYSRPDFDMDWRLVREHASELIRNRIGRPPSKRAVARIHAEAERDPHAAWKARARDWLAELRA